MANSMMTFHDCSFSYTEQGLSIMSASKPVELRIVRSPPPAPRREPLRNEPPSELVASMAKLPERERLWQAAVLFERRRPWLRLMRWAAVIWPDKESILTRIGNKWLDEIEWLMGKWVTPLPEAYR